MKPEFKYGLINGAGVCLWIALEYLLDEYAAEAFRRGYERVRPLPPIAEVRAVYRFLARHFRVVNATPGSYRPTEPGQIDLDAGDWHDRSSL